MKNFSVSLEKGFTFWFHIFPLLLLSISSFQIYIYIIYIYIYNNCHTLFRYLQRDKSLNLRQKNSRRVWYDQCLEVPEVTVFKKRLPKLDFLKAVSVTMTANSEQIEMKKSHHTYRFCIFSLPSPFALMIF